MRINQKEQDSRERGERGGMGKVDQWQGKKRRTRAGGREGKSKEDKKVGQWSERRKDPVLMEDGKSHVGRHRGRRGHELWALGVVY
jgi:hypothetical protein